MVHRDFIHVWPFEVDREEMTGKTEDDNPGIEGVGPIIIDDAVDIMRAAVRGNGLDEKAVFFNSFQGTVLHFETYQVFKIKPTVGERYLPGRQQGIAVGSRQEARNKVQAMVENAATNIDVHRTTIKFLKLRPDLGFSVEGWSIRYDGMKRSFVVHEKCTTCSGLGKNNCPDCKGTKRRPCKTCAGSKLMTCPSCKGRKQFPVKGKPQQQQQHPQHKGKDAQHHARQQKVIYAKCKKCSGQGKVRCVPCQGSGGTRCTLCQGTGKTGCKPCTNTGFRSHMTFMEVSAKCWFEYDKNALPPEVPPLIDFLKERMVLENYAHIRINEDLERKKELDNLHKPKEFMMRKPDEFAITYDVRLPWGDIGFIWDPRTEPVTGKLFGFHPSLVHMQPFLEEIALPGIRAVEEAGKGNAAVAPKLHEATRFRVIGDSMLASARFNKQRAVQAVMTAYPFGIRDEKVAEIVDNAAMALGALTQTPRIMGLIAGVAIAAGLDAAYYLGPVRDKVAEQIPNSLIQGAADLALIPIGALITVMLVKALPQKVLMGVMEPVLARRLRKNQKPEKLKPAAGASGFLGFLGVVAAYAAVVAAAVTAFLVPDPAWLEFLKHALHIG